MNLPTSLTTQFKTLMPALESVLLDGTTVTPALRTELSTLVEEARFLHEDTLADALDALQREMNAAPTDDREAILPALFAVQDILQDETVLDDAGDEHPAGRALDIDIRPELSAVLSIDARTERLINSAEREGKTVWILEVETEEGALDAVHEAIEANFAALNVARQEAPPRLAALVVSGASPNLSGIAQTVMATVRAVPTGHIVRRESLRTALFQSDTPISLVAAPDAMERVWLFLEQLRVERDQPGWSLWTGLRDALFDAMLVDVPAMIATLEGPLERLALDLGRRARLEFSGSTHRIAAEVAGPLRDVLAELVANALEHGIETPAARREAGKPEAGLIRCIVVRHGAALSIRVQDDGAGMDPQRIKKIRRQSEVHGLDRVRSVVEGRFGGKLTVRTSQRGSTVIVDLPATHGIFRGIPFTRADHHWVVPAAFVEHVVTLSNDSVVTDATGRPFLRYRNLVVPLLEPSERGANAPVVGAARSDHAIIVRLSTGTFACAADEVGTAAPVIPDAQAGIRLADEDQERTLVSIAVVELI